MGLQRHALCSQDCLGIIKTDGHLTSLCARRNQVKLQRVVGLCRFLCNGELDLNLVQKSTAIRVYNSVSFVKVQILLYLNHPHCYQRNIVFSNLFLNLSLLY